MSQPTLASPLAVLSDSGRAALYYLDEKPESYDFYNGSNRLVGSFKKPDD